MPRTFAKSTKDKLRRAVAYTKVAATLTNPLTYAISADRYRRGKGFTLPGSVYIGPYNKVPAGGVIHKKSEIPKSRGDALALEHDLSYGNYIRSGVNPTDLYTGYSDADRRLLHEADDRSYHGAVLKTGMLAKKGLYKLGIGSRIRDDDRGEGSGHVTHSGVL